MANYCEFTLEAYGNKAQLLKFRKWMEAEYKYSIENGVPKYSGTSDKHFRKVVKFNSKLKKLSNEYVLIGEGACNFGATECLVTPFLPSCYNASYDPFDLLITEHEVDLVKASKLLNIHIEMQTDDHLKTYSESFYITNGYFFCKRGLHYDEQIVPFSEL